MNVFSKLFTYYSRAYSMYECGEAIKGKAGRKRCHFGGWFYQQSVTGFPHRWGRPVVLWNSSW
jgi:hypothetical protein